MSRRSDDKSERSIYLLRDVMKLQQKKGHGERDSVASRFPLLWGLRVHSLLLLEAHMLKASLPGSGV